MEEITIYTYANRPLWSGPAVDIKHALQQALDQHANLKNANLRNQNLNEADLGYMDLRNIDFSGSNLTGADFRHSNISESCFNGANLTMALLQGSNCSHSTFDRADLTKTTLYAANVIGASFEKAIFDETILPAPSMMLLANWHDVSDELCLELMRYDASGHPDPKVFDVWQNTKRCPYDQCFVDRMAHFKERRHLWVPGPAKPAYELMYRVMHEKCKVTGLPMYSPPLEEQDKSPTKMSLCSMDAIEPLIESRKNKKITNINCVMDESALIIWFEDNIGLKIWNCKPKEYSEEDKWLEFLPDENVLIGDYLRDISIEPQEIQNYSDDFGDWKVSEKALLHIECSWHQWCCRLFSKRYIEDECYAGFHITASLIVKGKEL